MMGIASGGRVSRWIDSPCGTMQRPHGMRVAYDQALRHSGVPVRSTTTPHSPTSRSRSRLVFVC